MSLRARILGAAVLLTACRDLKEPTSTAMPTKRPDNLHAVTTPAPSRQGIDLAASMAEEKQLIDQAVALLPLEYQEPFRQKLSDPNSHINATSDPRISDLLSRLYALRRDRRHEERRLASVKEASKHSVPVLLALPDAAQPGAPVATVLRRRLHAPTDLIVLRSDATPEALATALSGLAGSRERVGDDLQTDVIRIAVTSTGTRAPSVQIRQIWTKLQNAPRTQVAGVGSARALTMRLNPRRKSI